MIQLATTPVHPKLSDEILKFLRRAPKKSYGKLKLLTSYHHGGYARVSDDLSRFIVQVENEHNLPLDHVYTGKGFFALVSEIQKGNFPRGAKILFLHTGGLQGRLPSD